MKFRRAALWTGSGRSVKQAQNRAVARWFTSPLVFPWLSRQMPRALGNPACRTPRLRRPSLRAIHRGVRPSADGPLYAVNRGFHRPAWGRFAASEPPGLLFLLSLRDEQTFFCPESRSLDEVQRNPGVPDSATAPSGLQRCKTYGCTIFSRP